jgi:hypothetical protein
MIGADGIHATGWDREFGGVDGPVRWAYLTLVGAEADPTARDRMIMERPTKGSMDA